MSGDDNFANLNALAQLMLKMPPAKRNAEGWKLVEPFLARHAILYGAAASVPRSLFLPVRFPRPLHTDHYTTGHSQLRGGKPDGAAAVRKAKVDVVAQGMTDHLAGRFPCCRGNAAASPCHLVRPLRRRRSFSSICSLRRLHRGATAQMSRGRRTSGLSGCARLHQRPSQHSRSDCNLCRPSWRWLHNSAVEERGTPRRTLSCRRHRATQVGKRYEPARVVLLTRCVVATK